MTNETSPALVQRDAVDRFLTHALAQGPVPVLELERRAREVGLLGGGRNISQTKVFRKARRSLGIRAFQHRRYWLWALLDAAASETHPKSEAIGSSDALLPPSSITGEPTTGIIDSSSEPADVVVAEDPIVATIRGWAAGISRLDPGRPLHVPMLRWRLFMSDAVRFVASDWAARAALKRWGALELFGIDARQPLVRLDRLGLLWRVEGGRILSLDHDGATIERSGNS